MRLNKDDFLVNEWDAMDFVLSAITDYEIRKRNGVGDMNFFVECVKVVYEKALLNRFGEDNVEQRSTNNEVDGNVEG